MQGSPAFKFPSRDEVIAFAWKAGYATLGFALTMFATWIGTLDLGTIGNMVTPLIVGGIANFVGTVLTDTRKISP